MGPCISWGQVLHLTLARSSCAADHMHRPPAGQRSVTVRDRNRAEERHRTLAHKATQPIRKPERGQIRFGSRTQKERFRFYSLSSSGAVDDTARD
jgi:hypothetical protein